MPWEGSSGGNPPTRSGARFLGEGGRGARFWGGTREGGVRTRARSNNQRPPRPTLTSPTPPKPAPQPQPAPFLFVLCFVRPTPPLEKRVSVGKKDAQTQRKRRLSVGPDKIVSLSLSLSLLVCVFLALRPSGTRHWSRGGVHNWGVRIKKRVGGRGYRATALGVRAPREWVE